VRQIFLFIILCVLLIYLFPSSSFPIGDFRVPPSLLPSEYGDVLMDRSSTKKEIAPVVFSHWVHKPKFTCTVCHTELEFPMSSSETPVTCEEGKMKAQYCAVCHNGKIAFGPKSEEGDNCKLCHNANASPNREKFEALQRTLPRSKFGNEIDWTKALKEGLIAPKRTLAGDGTSKPISIDRTLKLEAEWAGISAAVFPHNVHEQWLDCSLCHPDIFNIKKKTTRNLTMANIIKGEACGVCHLKVAFPLNDCKRCHPNMKM